MNTQPNAARRSRHRRRGTAARLLVTFGLGLATVITAAHADPTHADTAGHDDAFLDLTFEEAQTKARAENKMVMIDFFTTWCAPCRHMDETTFRDPKVNAWLRAKTVPIRVDADQNEALKGRYKVNEYPTFVFTNPVGHQRVRLVGFRDAATFLTDANAALTGAGELGRARTRFLAAKDDPARRLTYASALARAEQYSEALEHYLWCLDHQRAARQGLEASARQAVLNDLAHLGARFPPARQALVRRSDKLAASIALGETATPLRTQVRDFLAINTVGLDEPARSLALYDRLAATEKVSPVAREALGNALRPDLLQARRYADVARDLGAPAAHFHERLASYQAQAEKAADLPATLRAQASDVHREPLVTLGLDVYEVLLGTRLRPAAEQVAQQLRDLDPSPALRAALLERATRAGDKKAIASLKAASK